MENGANIANEYILKWGAKYGAVLFCPFFNSLKLFQIVK